MQDSKNINIYFLWQAFLKGDDKSFTIIYQQHIEGLISYGYKLNPDHDLVHDCIQEIFMDLFLKRKKISIKIEKLRPYLFVALRNCIGKKIAISKKFESFSSNMNEYNSVFNIEYSFQEKLIEFEVSQ